MSQLDLKRGERLYNKLSVQENLQKHSLCRLYGAIVLQFNPVFNFIFKTNFYLPRPIRLIMLINYFFVISLSCLLYFNWLPSELRIYDILWFGFSLMCVLTLIRPHA